jgi:cyclohexadieny/prephenate dehydrogenase
MTKPPLFNRVALIGIGLIGASLSHAMRRAGLVNEIAISTRSQETLDRAEELNLGNFYSTDAGEAVKDADCVILCVPVGASEAVTKKIAPHLKAGAIITDVGSVKCSVIDQIKPHLPEAVHFVPGHPIAGTEYSGPDAGFATLFENRWSILTPLEDTDQEATQAIKALWKGCGSNVSIMAPKHHDLVLAITSHLPHLIAYNIVGTAADLEDDTKSEVIKFSASGFRDFTRIAASDPAMWRDVFLHNREAVLEMLNRFTTDLAELTRYVDEGDGQALFDLFTRTRSIRKGIIDAGQEIDAPDFGRLS